MTAYPNGPYPFRTSLVVPCYNEARRLNTERCCQFLAASGNVCLIFVDDGSSDGTVDVLRKVQRQRSQQVQILTSPRNEGKAEAVRKGILFALSNLQPEMVGYWDADLATPLESAVRFAQVLDENRHTEMVFGARIQLCGRHIERRPARHYLGRVFATVVSTMLRIPIYDTQCGAKLFRVTPATSNIFAEPFLSKWVFDVEILARYLQLYDPGSLEKKIYEYPLEMWTDVAGSKVQPGDFFRAFVDIVRIRRKYF